MRRAGRPRRGWRAWGRSAGVLAAPTGRRRPRARGRSRSCTWRAGSRKLASGVALSTFLFDLDGTLIDSIELILRSYRHTMRLHRGHEPHGVAVDRGDGRDVPGLQPRAPRRA